MNTHTLLLDMVVGFIILHPVNAKEKKKKQTLILVTSREHSRGDTEVYMCVYICIHTVHVFPVTYDILQLIIPLR